MFKFSSMALAVSIAFGPSVFASPYILDASHSQVGFSVKHLMITNVKGEFKNFEGGFVFDDKKNEISKIDVKIDAKSVNTNDKKRDEHLIGDDFFATAKNPSFVFKADKPTKLEGNKAKVAGTLTMRGVSKPVVLDVEYNGAATDPWGNEKLGFVATTTVNRKDFGINWNKALDKGGVAVGEEVKITIEGQAVKKK